MRTAENGRIVGRHLPDERCGAFGLQVDSRAGALSPVVVQAPSAAKALSAVIVKEVSVRMLLPSSNMALDRARTKLNGSGAVGIVLVSAG
ncbi:hypothetical protein [Sphingomonas phyllosphaerae]|uniref:hypothetical protein n=1 Tax=Sphingomonas phyllosphaerae TaxID=257003 RepID=UPI0003B32983|nr:hypothetical protein [Sphingomonas phyllosphaerae]